MENENVYPSKIHFGSKKLGDGVNLLVDVVDLLGDGDHLPGEEVDLPGDSGNLLGEGGDPRSIAGGLSKTTVAQKCSGAMEIQKYDGSTNGLTWVGARDTCVSKISSV